MKRAEMLAQIPAVLCFTSLGDHAKNSTLKLNFRVPPYFSFEFRDAPNSTANCKTTNRKNMATNWSRFTVIELRAELKKQGLPTTGKKADLVERLATAEAEAEAEQTEVAQSEDEGVPGTDNHHAPPADAPTADAPTAPESRVESPQEAGKKSPSPSPAPAATPVQEGRDTDLSAQTPAIETRADGKRIIPFFHVVPITLFLTNPT